MRNPCTIKSGWIVAVIFWPDRLPRPLPWPEGVSDEYMEQLKREGRLIELLEERHNRAIAFCVDEPVPNEVEPYIRDRHELPEVVIRGRTLFGPVALLATEEHDDLSKFEEVDLPEGTFRAELLRTQLPSSLRKRYVQKHAGNLAWWILNLSRKRYWIAIVLFIAAMLAWSWLGWQAGIAGCSLVLLMAFACYQMRRSEAYGQASEVYEKFNQDHPSIIFRMTSITPDG